MSSRDLADNTIERFGQQWSRFPENEGWYGSVELLEDILHPLLKTGELAHKAVAEIGSGSGRIVGMLLEAGAGSVHAVEPSSRACAVLERNVAAMPRAHSVTVANERGDTFTPPVPLDYVVSIGVIHHIPDPGPVLKNARRALKPGGRVFIWVYGYEGNELYLALATPIRSMTTRLPHVALNACVWLLYAALVPYRQLARILPLPLGAYLKTVLWPMSPSQRRLVIYDQLNPSFAKYYTRAETEALLQKAGFVNVRLHHRHGYSWSALGEKPA